MKTLGLVAVCAVLLAGIPAFAQVATPPVAPGSIPMPETGYHQSQAMLTGTIVEVDLANGTLTLDNGRHFTLAPSLQWTSFPALGQEVQVLYDEQGGQSVVRAIDQSVHGSDGGGSQ